MERVKEDKDVLSELVGFKPLLRFSVWGAVIVLSELVGFKLKPPVLSGGILPSFIWTSGI